jgi:hypothetical protein
VPLVEMNDLSLQPTEVTGKPPALFMWRTMPCGSPGATASDAALTMRERAATHMSIASALPPTMDCRFCSIAESVLLRTIA